jgi:carboxyl-terminal processing protease
MKSAKNAPLRARRGRAGLRTAALIAAAFAGGMLSSSLGHATAEDQSPYFPLAQLGRALVLVENHYVDPVERARLVDGAIGGMVSELDPHSAYMPPQDYRIFQGETEGKFGGIGIEVDARGDVITVIAPIEGSPAEKAGIRSGDRIVAIDGEDTGGQSLDKLVRRMRGNPGTHVKLTILRAGEKEPKTFDLVREVIKVPSVAHKLLDGNIGYVRIKQFQERTHQELLAAAGKLRAESKAPISGVVLDLRSDPGGLVDEAAEVADEFLTSGTIYSMRHRGQIIEEAKARGGGAFSDVPVVILVNEYTASAAELVTGALQDNKRGVVVGANTFGKGSVQSIIDLPGGAGLRLTTARYYTPSGHAIQADGIHPDVLIESTTKPGEARRTTRERDLKGHLVGEGETPNKPDGGPTVVTAPDGGIDSTQPVARDVPSDPLQGSDFVLRVGYQILKSSLVGKGPFVR